LREQNLQICRQRRGVGGRPAVSHISRKIGLMWDTSIGSESPRLVVEFQGKLNLPRIVRSKTS
jgi:hypothetical protein